MSGLLIRKKLPSSISSTIKALQLNEAKPKFFHNQMLKDFSINQSNSFTTTCSSSFPTHVKIVEVGPRDGLQNESPIPDTNAKFTLIQKLYEAGCTNIETASFVNPKRIPAMADSRELMTMLDSWRRSENRFYIDVDHGDDYDLKEEHKKCTFSVLTPNLKGLEYALEAGAVDQVAIFGSASETFSEKNIQCSIDESYSRFEKVITQATQLNIPVRAYISCVLGCPYEGTIPPTKVAKMAGTLRGMGCHEISLGDTIGVGTPQATIEMLREVKNVVDKDALAVHFHDTYGQALANIYAALQEGIHIIDSSVAGLGGCPYAKGATGNVATEDVVYMLNGMGIHTGIDIYKLIDAGSYICDVLGKKTNSKCAAALAG